MQSWMFGMVVGPLAVFGFVIMLYVLPTVLVFCVVYDALLWIWRRL